MFIDIRDFFRRMLIYMKQHDHFDSDLFILIVSPIVSAKVY